jgi:predicted Rossmann fold nucleotide-binding protein DprA/Smf involved in DNA uptake
MALTWPQRLTWRSLPERQANFAGRPYARRREIAAEQSFADQMLLQMADAGSVDEIEALEQNMERAAAAAAPAVDVIEFAGDAHPAVRRVEKFWVPEQRNQAGLTPGQQKVLDAIREGHNSPKAIVDKTGYSASQVHNLLGDLTALGRIAKASYGQYAAAA